MKHPSPLSRLAPALLLPLALMGCAGPTLEPHGPVPTEAQLAWQRMEINMFCHFGPNTFSGAEWGDGTEPEALFAPTALDCRQWADVAAQAGMGGIILTAKHHDGFCLWPSWQSGHTVDTALDVLRALRQAVDSHPAHLKMGVYLSPWDRNHPTYGTEAYNDVFDRTLREVHRSYGPLFEQWFDGACGEGPNGRRQRYDWPRFMATMAELDPQCVVFSDIGPGCRWVGNEEGRAGETCWSTLDTEGSTPSDNKPAPEQLTVGHRGGGQWVPAEADVSIRPGWFWHPDEQPKPVDELMDIYFSSVGRNALLLLNVPPDTAGRIAPEDSAVLVAFRAERDRLFATDLAQGARIRASHAHRHHGAARVLDTAYHSFWAATDTVAWMLIDTPRPFDILMLQEYLPLGQRVARFDIEALSDGQWTPVGSGTTIGYKRLVRLPQPIRPERLRITLHGDAPPALNRIALYSSAR